MKVTHKPGGGTVDYRLKMDVRCLEHQDTTPSSCPTCDKLRQINYKMCRARDTIRECSEELAVMLNRRDLYYAIVEDSN